MTTPRWRLAAAIILITIGSGCARIETVPVVEPLPLPVRPQLPAITENELDCVDDMTYAQLVQRERLRRQYAERLEQIIQSTWPRNPPRQTE